MVYFKWTVRVVVGALLLAATLAMFLPTTVRDGFESLGVDTRDDLFNYGRTVGSLSGAVVLGAITGGAGWGAKAVRYGSLAIDMGAAGYFAANGDYAKAGMIAGGHALGFRLSRLGRIGKATSQGRAKQLAEFGRFKTQGFTNKQAFHLTQPYSGMGHHFAPRRSGLPNLILESRFNVLKPSGISRGSFYELHYRVDLKFHGTAFPDAIGGVWKGSTIGLSKLGLAGRLWHGSPRPLKWAIAGQRPVGSLLGVCRETKMEELKNHITFDADHLEAPHLSKEGEVVVPSGRNLAMNLVASLRSDGFESSNPNQRDYYGWEWTFEMDTFEVSCVLQVLKRVLLIVEARRGIKGLVRQEKFHAAAVKAIDTVVALLRQFPSVSNIESATRTAFEHDKA